MIKYLSLFGVNDLNYVSYSLCCSFCISFQQLWKICSQLNSFVTVFLELLCLGISCPTGECLNFSLLH